VALLFSCDLPCLCCVKHAPINTKLHAINLCLQYPVIAVENYLPVVDVFSGSQYGQINVLLAMGSAEQVAHLVRMKTEGIPASSGPQRPQHFLER